MGDKWGEAWSEYAVIGGWVTMRRCYSNAATLNMATYKYSYTRNAVLLSVAVPITCLVIVANCIAYSSTLAVASIIHLPIRYTFFGPTAQIVEGFYPSCSAILCPLQLL